MLVAGRSAASPKGSAMMSALELLRDRPGLALVASDVMKSPVPAVSFPVTEDTLRQLMQDRRTGHVVALDARHCLGIIDRDDLLRSQAVHAAETGPRDATHLLSLTPCVDPGTPLRELCRALLSSRHETVLVLDDDGMLHGTVTTSDVLRALLG